ncbi:MAG: hypothetical protein KJ042_04760 [Deltaproteobacteria bacterium]|nr:hypothetical protein [Deltaproteobacteria bacterium]
MNPAKIPIRALWVNWPLKVLSLVFAVLMWLYVSVGQTRLEVPKTAVLELRGLPANLVRTSDVVSAIDVKLQGSASQLRGIEQNSLGYELDMSQATPGRISFKVIDTRIKGLPSGVKVTELSPSEITITFSERVDKEMPVEVVTQGEPAFGYQIEEKSSEPKLVKVSGAIEEIATMNAVPTEPIDVAGRKDTYRGTHALNLVGRHVELTTPIDVDVTVRIRAEIVQRIFEKVAIEVENSEFATTVIPPAQDLRLKGPAEAMRNLDPGGMRLVIDAKGLEPGRHRVRPELRLPEGSDVLPLATGLDEVELTVQKSRKK